MQPANSQTTQQPQVIVPQDNFVRILGRYFGRALATVIAAVVMRLYRQRNSANTEPQQDANSSNHILNEVREDAAIAAASVFAWNSHIGGGTGADVSEYFVDRVSNLATHNLAETPFFPKSTVTVADRVTDNLLWRFTNFAANTVPEVRSVLQPPPRQDGLRYQF